MTPKHKAQINLEDLAQRQLDREKHREFLRQLQRQKRRDLARSAVEGPPKQAEKMRLSPEDIWMNRGSRI